MRRLLVRPRPQHSRAGAGRKGQGPLPRGIPAPLPPHLPAWRPLRQRSSRHRRRLPRQPNANSARAGIAPAAPNPRWEQSGGGNGAAAALAQRGDGAGGSGLHRPRSEPRRDSSQVGTNWGCGLLVSSPQRPWGRRLPGQGCLPPPLSAASRAAHLRALRRDRHNRRLSREKL